VLISNLSRRSICLLPFCEYTRANIYACVEVESQKYWKWNNYIFDCALLCIDTFTTRIDGRKKRTNKSFINNLIDGRKVLWKYRFGNNCILNIYQHITLCDMANSYRMSSCNKDHPYNGLNARIFVNIWDLPYRAKLHFLKASYPIHCNNSCLAKVYKSAHHRQKVGSCSNRSHQGK
jgi:hypothetical protein